MVPRAAPHLDTSHTTNRRSSCPATSARPLDYLSTRLATHVAAPSIYPPPRPGVICRTGQACTQPYASPRGANSNRSIDARSLYYVTPVSYVRCDVGLVALPSRETARNRRQNAGGRAVRLKRRLKGKAASCIGILPARLRDRLVTRPCGISWKAQGGVVQVVEEGEGEGRAKQWPDRSPLVLGATSVDTGSFTSRRTALTTSWCPCRLKR